MSTPTVSTREPHEIVDSPDQLDPLDLVLSPDEFKAAFRGLAAGVAVVTAAVGEEKAAMTATSVASLSATPPLFVFSASQLSSATEVISQADTVVVHILASDQLGLAKLCATSKVDRFGDPAMWDILPTGEPRFHGADVWIRGRIVSRFTAGASILHVVEAIESNASPDAAPSDAKPLVYHNRTWHALDGGSAVTA